MEKDPQVREQLQALIEQRKRKRKEFWKKFESPEPPEPTPEQARRAQEQARREQRECDAMFVRGVIGFAIGGVVTCLVVWGLGLTGGDLIFACFFGFLFSCMFVWTL